MRGSLSIFLIWQKFIHRVLSLEILKVYMSNFLDAFSKFLVTLVGADLKAPFFNSYYTEV